MVFYKVKTRKASDKTTSERGKETSWVDMWGRPCQAGKFTGPEGEVSFSEKTEKAHEEYSQ